MNRQIIIKRLIIVLVAASFIPPAFAILGVGDVVYDPTNYAQALQRYAQLQQQYSQLVQTYLVISNLYRQMKFMAQQVPVAMESRYRALATPWLNSSAANVYGNTGDWVTGVNTGLGVGPGYLAATQPLGTYGSALGNVAADQLPRVESNYATVELADGANLNAMETIGRLRANAPAVELAIQNLENDSLSSDTDMNSEIAVLNKISAAHMIMVRNTQDTNKLLVAVAEHQLVDAKNTRDAEAEAINNHIRFMTDGKAALDSQASGASAAMLAWRMP